MYSLSLVLLHLNAMGHNHRACDSISKADGDLYTLHSVGDLRQMAVITG